MGHRPRNPQKTQRKWIVGGCRKCRQPRENHGRGLCGACYAEEAAAKRLDCWPKLAAVNLTDEPVPAPAAPRAPELPLLPHRHSEPRPRPNPNSEPITVTLTLPPEGRDLWERLEREARELWRPVGHHICHKLSVAWAGSRPGQATP